MKYVMRRSTKWSPPQGGKLLAFRRIDAARGQIWLFDHPDFDQIGGSA